MSPRRAGAPLIVLAVALAGCGGSGGENHESARDLLERAKTALDDASAVHFVLTSEGGSASGPALVGGEGDLARPSAFEGTLHVRAMGAGLNLPVVSVDGTVYAELPFTSGFSVVRPGDYGFSDPGALLDPGTGLSSLLTVAEDAELGDERRIDGEVVREVTADLPGDRVEQVLTSADPSRPVRARLSVATETGQVLRMELTGPFFSTDDATFTLELSDYGADVDITAPAVG